MIEENMDEKTFEQAVEETKNKMDMDAVRVKANISAFIKVNLLSEKKTENLLNLLNKHNVLEEIVIDGLTAIVNLPQYSTFLEFYTTNNKYVILVTDEDIKLIKNGELLNELG